MRKVPIEPQTLSKSKDPSIDFHFDSQVGRPVLRSCLDFVILLIEKSDKRMLVLSSRNNHSSFGTMLLSILPRIKVVLLLFGLPQMASLCVSDQSVGNESLALVCGVPTGVGTPEVST